MFFNNIGIICCVMPSFVECLGVLFAVDKLKDYE